MTQIIICALIPMLAAVRLHLGGAITPGEILLLFLSCFLVKQIRLVFRLRLVKLIFGFLVFYLVVQMLTDFYRGIPSIDYLRGWARIGLMTFAYVALGALVLEDHRRMLAFSLGGAMAGVVATTLFDPEGLGLRGLFGETGYKFIIGGLISILAFVVAGYGRRRFGGIVTLVPVVAGGLAFAMNCRSLAGVTLLSWVVLQFVRFKPGEPHRFTGRRVIQLAAIVVGGLLIYGTYLVMAPQGLLGEVAKKKFEMQAGLTGGQFSLMSGRNELHFSWPKIAASPVVGYGSWAKDRLYVYQKGIEAGMSPEYAAMFTARFDGLIPTHSHLFGAWVEAGIVGAAFWAFVFLLSGRVLLLDGFAPFGPLKPLLVYLFVNFEWDLLFRRWEASGGYGMGSCSGC